MSLSLSPVWSSISCERLHTRSQSGGQDSFEEEVQGPAPLGCAALMPLLASVLILPALFTPQSYSVAESLGL